MEKSESKIGDQNVYLQFPSEYIMSQISITKVVKQKYKVKNYGHINTDEHTNHTIISDKSLSSKIKHFTKQALKSESRATWKVQIKTVTSEGRSRPYNKGIFENVLGLF